MIETDLLQLFIDRAPFKLPMVRLFRRNIIRHAAVIDGRKVFLANGIVGQADAYALVRGGRHVEIETKSAVGKLRDAQKRWRAYCLRECIPYLMPRALKDELPNDTVNRWIEELRAIL